MSGTAQLEAEELEEQLREQTEHVNLYRNLIPLSTMRMHEPDEDGGEDGGCGPQTLDAQTTDGGTTRVFLGKDKPRSQLQAEIVGKRLVVLLRQRMPQADIYHRRHEGEGWSIGSRSSRFSHRATDHP